jgi:hypothetical protein
MVGFGNLGQVHQHHGDGNVEDENEHGFMPNTNLQKEKGKSQVGHTSEPKSRLLP